MKKNKTLQVGTFADVTDGIHTSIDYDNSSNIKLISATSPRENIFDFSREAFISEKAHVSNLRTSLKENDVIISTVGTIGNCAVVNKEILPANSDRHVGIIRMKNNYSPYVLSTFLLTKYGRMQTLRESTGNVQLNLFIYKIKELLIPELSELFQQQIEKIVKTAHIHIEKSKALYSEAENLLLEELGLKDWTPKEEAVNIKTINDFKISGRLDAEYYQPKYDEIEEKIKNYRGGYNIFSNFVSNYSTGYAFDSKSYIDYGMPLIRINNIKKGMLDISNATYISNEDAKLSIKDIVKENDLLISMSGTIGNCCKVPKDTNAVINQRILKCSIKEYDSDVLCLIINSIIGNYQFERIGTGGVQTNISNNDMLNIFIPIIDLQIQNQISEKIQESFRLRAESEGLLHLAKLAVETAIEEGEDKALRLIDDYKATKIASHDN